MEGNIPGIRYRIVKLYSTSEDLLDPTEMLPTSSLMLPMISKPKARPTTK